MSTSLPGVRSLPTVGISDAVLSPDGKTMYIVRGDRVAAIDTATGNQVRNYLVGLPISAISISSDGRYVAAVQPQPHSNLKAGFVWRIDVASGTVDGLSLQPSPGERTILDDVQFLPDGTLLVSNSDSNFASRLIRVDFTTRQSTVLDTSFPRYERGLILSGSTDGTRVIIDPRASYNVSLYSFTSATGEVKDFNPLLYDPFAGASIPNPARKTLHAISADGGQIFDAERRLLFSANGDGERTLPDPLIADGAVFSPDGTRLYLTHFTTGRVLAIRVSDGAVLGGYLIGAEAATTTVNYGNTLQISRDGRFLYVMVKDAIQVIDLSVATLTGGTPGADVLGGERVLFGFDGDDVLTAAAGGSILWGGRGNDTYILNSDFSSVNEEIDGGTDTILSPKDYSLPSYTENLNLTGSVAVYGAGNAFANRLIGNAAANTLLGYSGNDVLEGMGGDDLLDGGDGADHIDGGEGNDTASYQVSFGAVNVNLATGRGGRSINPTEDTLVAIENVHGSSYNDLLTGNDGPNRLVGDHGDDVLIGGAGADVLDGGSGNDLAIYEDSPGGVWVNLLIGRAYGSVAEGDVLTAIENLRGSMLADTLRGDEGANRLQGLDGDDVLDGSGGNDTLEGGAGNDYLIGAAGNDILQGGSGANTLQGGAGNDVYIIEGIGDSIVEFAGEGADEVRTDLPGFVLPANVENLTASGNARHSAFIGNDGDNVIVGGTGYDEIYGRDGNDRLSGGGGAVADTLIGGRGNDVYLVDVVGTSTIEDADEGIDEVRTGLSDYVLQPNIERLTSTAGGGRGALIGNASDNAIFGGTRYDEIYGREGNDSLFGGPGSANTLFGGQGNDIYFVQAFGDSVIEFSNEGFDTVRTSLPIFVLRDHVEALISEGGGRFTGIGSDGTDNLIVGGAGADFLSGLGGNDVLIGGSGNDELLGGAGADQFRYLGGETGLDRIYDFTSGEDKIVLLLTGFSRTESFAVLSGPGGARPSTISTFFYDSGNGIVSYDADGSGPGAAVQLAQLNTGLTLTTADFLFI